MLSVFFFQSSHMAMIDALMMAYTVEMISIEKVVASVKRFSTFSASKELPYDLEDAMVFWINKVKFTLGEACLSFLVTFQIFKKVQMSIFLSYLCISVVSFYFCNLFFLGMNKAGKF